MPQSDTSAAFFTGQQPPAPDQNINLGVPQEQASKGTSSTTSSSHQALNAENTSGNNKVVSVKMAEEHVALFTAMIKSCDNLISGKMGDMSLTAEDYSQVDPDDLEEMDIQWNMAMIVQRAKSFMSCTGRNAIGGGSKT